MSSAKKTPERKQGTPATKMETSKHSEEGVPGTASRGKPPASETPASVEGLREETLKVVAGRMPLTSDMSVSLVGSSESGKSGHVSTTEGPTNQQARSSVESNRPGKGSAGIERSMSGLEERDSSSLPQEDVEDVGEFLHEWEPQKAIPKIPSLEEDHMLKSPPPDFVLGPEQRLRLHGEIRKKLWQAYRLVSSTTFAEAEQSSKVVEAISRARDELAEKKARQVFEQEHQRKRHDLQSQLEETARQM